MTPIEQLRENVNKSKEEFIMEVGRLNYVIKIMNETPSAFSDSSLTSAVRGVSKSYENFVNSKIEFTDEYFKDEYFKNKYNDTPRQK
jgi:hypothetical protein